MKYDLALIGCDIGGICACYVLEAIEQYAGKPAHIACNGFSALSLVLSDLYPAKTRDTLLEEILLLRSDPHFHLELELLLSDLKHYQRKDLKTPLLFPLAKLSDSGSSSLCVVSSSDPPWYSSSLYDLIFSSLSPYFTPSTDKRHFCDAAVYFGCCPSVFHDSEQNRNLAVLISEAKSPEDKRLIPFRRLVDLTLDRFQQKTVLVLEPGPGGLAAYIAKVSAAVQQQESIFYNMLFPNVC